MDIHLLRFKSYSKLSTTTFKEAIHHLEHLKVTEFT